MTHMSNQLLAVDCRDFFFESLQDYANRTGRTVRHAYANWHETNSAKAARFAHPFTRAFDRYEHVQAGGGRCLGLLPSDVRAVDAGVY